MCCFRVFALVLLLFLQRNGLTCLAYSASPKILRAGSIIYRPGQPSDVIELARKMALQLQNPLEATSSASNFVVALEIDSKDDGSMREKLVGWVQLKPLEEYNLRSSRRFDARPGSYDLQEEIDDQMWDEFLEDESIQIPTGWASLPWSPEYRKLEASVQARQKRRAELEAEQQAAIRKSRVPLWELKSLFVEPLYRENGIARGLIHSIQEEYASTGKDWSNVHLITRKPSFFYHLGIFERIKCRSQIPMSLNVPDGYKCLRGSAGPSSNI